MRPGEQEKPAPPRVIVVDDDADVLRTVCRLLEREGFPVESHLSPEGFLARPRVDGPCCLLLDVHMPGLTGLQLQERLQADGGAPPIVFMSGAADVATSVRAMKSGAVDFLIKPFSSQELFAAVRAALARAERDLAERRRRDAARERLARLTPREREVCEAVVRGLRSRDIAEELGTAEKTVNIHRSNAMRKLGAESVIELVELFGQAR